jgi:hypothetical protein
MVGIEVISFVIVILIRFIMVVIYETTNTFIHLILTQSAISDAINRS